MSEKSAAELFAAALAALPKPSPEQSQKAAEAKTAKIRAGLIERLKRWKERDVWRLSDEASALALGLEPGSGSASLLDDTDARCAQVFDLARRSVEAKGLTVTNPTAPPEQWWVRPEVFAGWLQSRSIVGPAAAMEAFAAVFPSPSPAGGSAQSARETFIQSGYTTRALELAFEAIAELWLPYREGKRPRRPTVAEVKEFLKARGVDSDNSMSQIDAVIRLDEEKAGGILPAKGSTGKISK